MEDTLFHINWGDGDTTFVIAPDEQTAKERMGDGEDMVNSMVRLDHLYQMIFKAGYEQREKDPLDKEDRCDKCYKQGIREVVEWMRVASVVKHYEYTDDNGKKWMGVSFCITPKQWQAKLKEWGL